MEKTKSLTERLLEQIEQEHDWAKGQVYGGTGLQLGSTDTCRICSLQRHWFSDRQNGISAEYKFTDGETGQDLSLRQAAKRGCANDDE